MKRPVRPVLLARRLARRFARRNPGVLLPFASRASRAPFAASLALLWGGAGCGFLSGCHAKANEGDVARGPLAPVAAPAALIVEGVVATPDATWQRFQHGVGGGAGLLPTTLGGIVCAATGLDARLGAEITGASPAYLVAAGDPASPGWLLAMRLVEERRARPLFEGASAIFDARDAGPGVVELSARGKASVLSGAAGSAVVAIAPGGWLVLGSTADALQELAPYATRTLATKGATGTGTGTSSITLDVPRWALAGSLAEALGTGWGDAEHAMLEDDRALREAHGGRAPDFGDPRAIMTVLDAWMQKKLAALRDLRGLHVAIDVGENGVSAVVTAPPASANGAASEIVGALLSSDSAPLARLPRETVLALFLSNGANADARAGDAAEVETALVTTLGTRLTPADAKRVHVALDDWYGARGDWATLGLTMTPTDRGVVADVATSDPARASRGVREALDLLAHVPAIREPFGAWLHVRDIKLGGADLPGGGRASVASFTTDQPSPFALAWTPASPAASAALHPGDAGDLKLALGAAPLPLIAPVQPGGTLGPVAGAIVAQPGRSPGCNATGGIVLAWGTRAGQAGQAGQADLSLWATVAASDSSLRCAVKTFF
jgi:hypothetical protein